MKKKICIAIILMSVLFLFAGCELNKTGNRITGGKDVQTFTYCYVALSGQEITRGAVTQWRDYTDSDVVQVLVNGKYYLTHYTNIVLIADPEQGALSYSNVSWNGVEE